MQANFNYCLFLVDTSLPEKLKTFKNAALGMNLLDDYETNYETLIKKKGISTI